MIVPQRIYLLTISLLVLISLTGRVPDTNLRAAPQTKKSHSLDQQPSAQMPELEDGIRAVLTWDTDQVDIDLHIFDLQGNHAWYGNRRGIPGASLHNDDTDGFGPETFTAPSPEDGTYIFRVNFYGADSGDEDNYCSSYRPTNVTLNITVDGEDRFLQSHRLTTADCNAGDGETGSPASLWEAYRLIICNSDGCLEVSQCINGKYFLEGPDISNRYDILQPESADEARFALNSQEETAVFAEDKASIHYNMGEDLNYAILGASNTLVREALRDGGNIGSHEQEIIGFGIPLWLDKLFIQKTGYEQEGHCRVNETSSVKYFWETEIPKRGEEISGDETPPEEIPYLGNTRFGIKKTSGVFRLEMETTGDGTFDGGAKTGFYVAGDELEGKLSGKGTVGMSEEDEFTFKEGSLGIEISGKIEKERPLVDVICKAATGGACPLKEAETIPILGSIVRWFNSKAVAKATIEPTIGGALNIASGDDGLEWQSSTISAKIKLTLAAALNIVKNGLTAEIFGGGQPSATYQVPADPSYLKELAIKFFGGVKLKVWRYERQYSGSYSWKHEQQRQDLFLQPSLSHSQWQPIPRDYLESPNYATFTANQKRIQVLPDVLNQQVTEDRLIFNTFSDGHPDIATEGNTDIVVWVHDDINKPIMQGEEIYYSVRQNEGFWSPAAAITNDALQDFSPQVVFSSASQAIAVWERNKNNQSAASELNAAYTKGFEIAYSVWNGSTWSSPAFITNNTDFDFSPTLLRGNDGTPFLIWRQNAQGELLGHSSAPDKLMYSLWNGSSWTQPQALQENVVGMLSMDAARHNASNMGVVYSRDTDGDYGTSADQEIFQVTWNGAAWSSPTQLTNDNQADNNPHLLYDTAGNERLLWLKEGKLVANLNDNIEEIQHDGSGTILDYTVVQDQNNNLALFWQDHSDRGVDIFFATYEAQYDAFSNEVQLTDDRSLEKFMAPAVTADGQLRLVYNKTILETADIVVSPDLIIEETTALGRTDLFFLEHTFGPDLVIATDDLVISPETPKPNASATFAVTFSNEGGRAVENPVVRVYLYEPVTDEQTLIEEKTISGTMLGGTSQTVTVNWTVPAEGDPFIVYAEVDPNDLIAELDEGNNSTSIIFETEKTIVLTSSGNVYLPLIRKR